MVVLALRLISQWITSERTRIVIPNAHTSVNSECSGSVPSSSEKKNSKNSGAIHLRDPCSPRELDVDLLSVSE